MPHKETPKRVEAILQLLFTPTWPPRISVSLLHIAHCKDPCCGLGNGIEFVPDSLRQSLELDSDQYLSTVQTQHAPGHRAFPTWSTNSVPCNMAYVKKDEDADTALLKIDRVSVFQEGGLVKCPLTASWKY